MADWKIVCNWMMDSEDPSRACREVPDACPGGVKGPCFAISGINSAAFPATFADLAALPADGREAAVLLFYRDRFWNRWYEQLRSDDLAKRVFDFAVNAGSGTGVRCLQQAINALAAPGSTKIGEDGAWGPATVAAANAADAAALTAAFTEKRVARYEAIVAAGPAKACYLKGWIARARR